MKYNKDTSGRTPALSMCTCGKKMYTEEEVKSIARIALVYASTYNIPKNFNEWWEKINKKK